MFCLHLSPVRQYLVHKISTEISRTIGADVSIEDAEIGLFNRIILYNVDIKDQQKKDILKSKLISAKIEWRSLWQDKLTLRTVSLLDADIFVYKLTEKSNSNIQFIIDKFKSEKENKKSLNLKINSLIFRRINVKYDEFYRPLSPHQFNLGHLHISNIDANISLKNISTDSLSLRCRSLSFQEASGLKVNQLSFNGVLSKNAIRLKNITVELPYSKISQNKIDIRLSPKNSSSFIKRISSDGIITPQIITPSDFKCFIPKLKDINYACTFSSKYKISHGDMEFNDLSIHIKNKLYFQANGELSYISPKKIKVDTNIQNLSCQDELIKNILNIFLNQKKNPILLLDLGNIKLRGHFYIDTDQNKYQANCILNSDYAHAVAKLNVQQSIFTVAFSAKNIQLSRILDKNSLPSNIDVKGNFKIDTSKEYVKLNVLFPHLTYNKYTYNNIHIKGGLQDKIISGTINSSDKNAFLTTAFTAERHHKIISNLKIDAKVNNLNLTLLGFKDLKKEATYKGKLSLIIPSFKQFPYIKKIDLKDFTMAESHSPYHLNQLSLDITPSNLFLSSDFAQISIDGPINKENFRNAFEYFKSDIFNTKKSPIENLGWNIHGKIFKTDIINKIFNIPLHSWGTTSIDAKINTNKSHSFFTLDAPYIEYNNHTFKNIKIYIQENNGKYNSLIQTNTELGKNSLATVLQINKKDNQYFSHLSWQDVKHSKIYGAIKMNGQLIDENKHLHVDILPTIISLGDSIWNIEKGSVDIAHKQINVQDINIHHKNQSLSIAGALSKAEHDSIMVNIKNINVDYILNLINFDAVEFSGLANGNIKIKENKQAPILEANIHIPDFYFNKGPMGSLNLEAAFNFHKKNLTIDGKMLDSLGGKTNVLGNIDLLNKRLNLDINNSNTNLRFLRKYVDGFFDDFEGRGTGYITIFGPLQQLDLKGKEEATASAKVIATGVRYKVPKGTLEIIPGKFIFKDFLLKDSLTGSGIAQGEISHNHFKNLKYNFQIHPNILLVYDKNKDVDLPFNAKVFGSGNINLSGIPGSFQADITMTPDKNTIFNYIIDKSNSISANQFITIQPDTSQIKESSTPSYPESETSSDIRINLNINVRPDALINVIMDEKSGDILSTRGIGSIRALFYNKGQFQMYGTYSINEGSYKMSFQNIIRKNFTFKPGSMISFSGDPYQGDINMQALYTIKSASLADLNIGNTFNTHTTKVNCLLNISGKVNQPQISFDLDFPNINEEEKQMIRQLIASDEDLNTQIIYLLGIGRFYTPNFSQKVTNSGESQTGAAMKSFLSSTFSSQINDIISNALGTTNWSFGTNLSTGSLGTNSMEFEGLLSGRLLNNRLIINGNFGYKDRAYNTTNFIGDFNAQYLLTKTGNISLKAYSETNDRYFTKSSLTTQGIGILLRRDFNNIKDLFIRKRKK